MPSTKERRKFVDDFYSKAKKPIRDLVKSTPGLSITNILAGSHQAILRAPKEVWVKLMEGSNCFTGKDFVLQPNNTFATIS